MKAQPLTHFTKDGKEVIIREATEDDARGLIELKKSYIKNTTSIPLYDFEYKNDIQMERDWIRRFITETNSLLLVAEHDNKLIGNIDLNGNQRKKLLNRKIGSFLMGSIMKWAANKSPLNIIWLEVYSTNAGGIKLYEKFGFEQCGLIKNFFEEENPADKITMVKHI